MRDDNVGGLKNASPGTSRSTARAPTRPSYTTPAPRLTASGLRRDVIGELANAPARPFPLGYTEQTRADLPARDGVAHGGVKRSAAAPNFTQGTKPEDRITLDIEVLTNVWPLWAGRLFSGPTP